MVRSVSLTGKMDSSVLHVPDSCGDLALWAVGWMWTNSLVERSSQPPDVFRLVLHIDCWSVDFNLLTDWSGLCLGFYGPEFTKSGEVWSWLKGPEVNRRIDFLFVFLTKFHYHVTECCWRVLVFSEIFLKIQIHGFIQRFSSCCLFLSSLFVTVTQFLLCFVSGSLTQCRSPPGQWCLWVLDILFTQQNKV